MLASELGFGWDCLQAGIEEMIYPIPIAKSSVRTVKKLVRRTGIPS